MLVPTLGACDAITKHNDVEVTLMQGHWQQDSSRMNIYHKQAGGKRELLSSAKSEHNSPVTLLVTDKEWTWDFGYEQEVYPYTRQADSLIVHSGSGYRPLRWKITDLTAHSLRVRWEFKDGDFLTKSIVWYFSR